MHARACVLADFYFIFYFIFYCGFVVVFVVVVFCIVTGYGLQSGDYINIIN